MTLGKMDKLIIHHVGNKNNGDGVRFSDDLTEFEDIEDYISQLINNSFKSDELYQFHFLPSLELNPIYQFITDIFKRKGNFISQSHNIARYLYDKSIHPQIKAGELCVAYFKDCQLNGEIIDCVGLFKSENKETILKISQTKIGYNLKSEEGINTNKLDKGCLIFNINEEDGDIVSIVDNTNKGSEAQYWTNDFLQVKPTANEYNQTNQFLGITKQFVTKQLTEDFEVGKADQIDLLNRSVDYFKTHDTFNKREFEKEVFQDADIIKSFRKFDNHYREENDIDLTDDFEISQEAVKKQSRAFKSVLKLDKNFHIYIHGNRELIEQGIERDGRKYYKIYYEKEG